MKQTVEAKLEFNWKPVLWAALTMVITGLVANFVLFRPGWIVPGAFLAGCVAALRSSYYQPSSNNGMVGVVLGMAVLAPVIALSRVILHPKIQGLPDLLFGTGVLSIGFMIMTAMILLPFGYMGGAVVDTVQKRVSGPVGY